MPENRVVLGRGRYTGRLQRTVQGLTFTQLFSELVRLYGPAIARWAARRGRDVMADYWSAAWDRWAPTAEFIGRKRRQREDYNTQRRVRGRGDFTAAPVSEPPLPPPPSSKPTGDGYAVTTTKMGNRRRVLKQPLGFATYAGHFKRRLRNKRRFDPYRSRGSTSKLVITGSVSHADTVAVAHSTGVPQFAMQTVGRALFRKLYEMTKRDVITDWDAVPAGTSGIYSHRIFYRADALSAETNTAVVGFTGALSFAQMATELTDAIMALYTEANDAVVLERVQLFKDVGATVDEDQWSLELRGAMLSIDVSSILNIQNVTESSTAGTNDHTNALDIRANPLIGRCYKSRSNMFMVHNTDNENLVADERHGTVNTDGTGGPVHVPAPNYYSNAKISGSVHLGPGKLKKSKLRTVKRTSLNKFMMMIKRWLIHNAGLSSGNDHAVPFGESKLYWFEHMMRANIDEAVAFINYEVAVFCKAYLQCKVNRDATRVDFTS